MNKSRSDIDITMIIMIIVVVILLCQQRCIIIAVYRAIASIIVFAALHGQVNLLAFNSSTFRVDGTCFGQVWMEVVVVSGITSIASLTFLFAPFTFVASEAAIVFLRTFAVLVPVSMPVCMFFLMSLLRVSVPMLVPMSMALGRRVLVLRLL